MYLIHQLVEPSFEAFSLLRVTPTNWTLFRPSEEIDFKGATPYLQTQIGVINSDRVLAPAIARPEIVNLSTITNADDPRNFLRKHMTVEIIRNAYLIRVALELADKDQAAKIVNSVVNEYLEYNNEQQRVNNSKLRSSLSDALVTYKAQIDEKRAELKKIIAKGTLSPKTIAPTSSKKVDDESQPEVERISEEQSARLAQEMLDNKLAIIKLEADIKTLEDAKQSSEGNEKQLSALGDKERDEQIQDEFRKDPEVIALCEDIATADEQRAQAKAKIRQGNDPARQLAEQKFKKLLVEYDKLWKVKYEDIAARLRAANDPSQGSEALIASLKIKLASLNAQRLKQAEFLKELIVVEKEVNNDSFEATFVNHQLDILLKREEQVGTNLQQLEFEANQQNVRVSLLDPAVPPKGSTDNKRFKYMAVAPIALLFMILGLFCLLEVMAERVADPDALSTRVRSEVYALPPLPTARAIRKLSEPAAADQIEQFIQRLDHLRFAVCGSPSELGKGRCVLITSAVGGEGKSTLAAQLAARCGNAGMSTLLIDADLRRTALCPLLDVPEGPGLSDVLKEEATPDDVVIPVQGGTFYLLRAGTPIQDTNRLFQNRNLGLLIAQFRQFYDLIIIDSPPVLPVPDALILGRWVDGAVIAARYDISRFPQVERARRQLDNAGIPIMGTVINGMRNADSYYGRYSYSRRRSPQPSSSDTI
jgi:polysaccharide biosynthesis transport protein